jgi:hypothetical protein
VIRAEVKTRDIEADLKKMAKSFGESNHDMIARWGVATCRDLIQSTQAWGTKKDAKKKQETAIWKDINRAVYVIFPQDAIRKLKKKKLTEMKINGRMVKFTPDQNLTSAKKVNDFIDLNRTTRKARVPRLAPDLKGACTYEHRRTAAAARMRRIGKAKGGWIGAGIAIGAKSKMGSRITIGKNIANYAHKFKSEGSATIARSVWSPVGKITNNVAHVSTDYVLKKSDAKNAILHGALKTMKWYKSAIKARLKKAKSK